MNVLLCETHPPMLLSIPEQGMIDRQAFEREQSDRDEKLSRKLLSLLAPEVSETYSWLRTKDAEDTLVLVGGDTQNGTLPILAKQLN